MRRARGSGERASGALRFRSDVHCGGECGVRTGFAQRSRGDRGEDAREPWRAPGRIHRGGARRHRIGVAAGRGGKARRGYCPRRGRNRPGRRGDRRRRRDSHRAPTRGDDEHPAQEGVRRTVPRRGDRLARRGRAANAAGGRDWRAPLLPFGRARLCRLARTPSRDAARRLSSSCLRQRLDIDGAILRRLDDPWRQMAHAPAGQVEACAHTHPGGRLGTRHRTSAARGLRWRGLRDRQPRPAPARRHRRAWLFHAREFLAGRFRCQNCGGGLRRDRCAITSPTCRLGWRADPPARSPRGDLAQERLPGAGAARPGTARSRTCAP